MEKGLVSVVDLLVIIKKQIAIMVDLSNRMEKYMENQVDLLIIIEKGIVDFIIGWRIIDKN